MAEEQCEVEPGQSAAVSGVNGGAIFLFRGREVFLFFRNPAVAEVRKRPERIELELRIQMLANFASGRSSCRI